jgi:hypothetical protein
LAERGCVLRNHQPLSPDPWRWVGLYSDINESVLKFTGDVVFLELDFDQVVYLILSEPGSRYFD